MPSREFFQPMPHEEAAAMIGDKQAVGRKVFDALRPELKARAFVVTGIEDMKVVGRIRDAIAKVPQGGSWDEAKDSVLAELAPYYDEQQAEIRGTILMRYHVFQAYGSAHWHQLQATGDVFTHWQYLTFGDDKVRASHKALDGLVLPKDHPFWDTHFPPWEYNCRCQVRGVMPEEVAEMEDEDADLPPEEQRVASELVLKRLETEGRLDRGPGKIIDVRSPREKAHPDDADKVFRNVPGDFSIPLRAIEDSVEPEEWDMFQEWAKKQDVEPGLSVWQWLRTSEAKRLQRLRARRRKS